MTLNGHGGKRPGAGRPKGRRNRATLAREAGLPDAVEAARALVDDVWEMLGAVVRDPEAPAAARVRAGLAILDRAYGKPPLPKTRSVALLTPEEIEARRAEREAERASDPFEAVLAAIP